MAAFVPPPGLSQEGPAISFHFASGTTHRTPGEGFLYDRVHGTSRNSRYDRASDFVSISVIPTLAAGKGFEEPFDPDRRFAGASVVLRVIEPNGNGGTTFWIVDPRDNKLKSTVNANLDDQASVGVVVKAGERMVTAELEAEVGPASDGTRVPSRRANVHHYTLRPRMESRAYILEPTTLPAGVAFHEGPGGDTEYDPPQVGRWGMLNTHLTNRTIPSDVEIDYRIRLFNHFTLWDIDFENKTARDRVKEVDRSILVEFGAELEIDSLSLMGSVDSNKGDHAFLDVDVRIRGYHSFEGYFPPIAGETLLGRIVDEHIHPGGVIGPISYSWLGFHILSDPDQLTATGERRKTDDSTVRGLWIPMVEGDRSIWSATFHTSINMSIHAKGARFISQIPGAILVVHVRP